MASLKKVFPDGFKAHREDYTSPITDPPEIQFRDALDAFGLEIDGYVVADGKIYRNKVIGDKGGKKSGWHIMFRTGDIYTGVFGNWRTGETQSWTERINKPRTFADQAEVSRLLSEAKRLRDEQIKGWQEDAAEKAAEILSSAHDAKADHPYLLKKSIAPPKGLKQINGHLHAPVLNFDGEIMSIQTIDKTGSKLFLKGGSTKGGFFPLQGDTSTIYVGEGIATCATVHEATGASVFAAFSAGNLKDVALGVKREYPASQIVLLADNDDAGKQHSDEAAKAVGGAVVLADGAQGCDFNDLGIDGTRIALGITVVTEPVETERPPEEAQIEQETIGGVSVPDMIKSVPGMLGEYVTHILASSRKPQPVYAVAAALVVGSALVARMYETCDGDRSGIYVMGVGPTGSGKEIGRECNKHLLRAANVEDRIGGEEIKSDTGLLMLMSRSNASLIQLDEFGLMLQRFSSQRAGGHEKAVVTLLMKLWSSTSTTLYGPQFAREERVDIQFPSANLFLTTTAETLWPALSGTEILSGALNRIIICEIDSPDSTPVRPTARPAAIPQAVVDWATTAVKTPNPLATPEMPFQIGIDAAAYAALADYAEKTDIEARKYRGTGIDSLFVRAPEQIKRIAMVVAVSVNVQKPVVTFEVMTYAIAFVNFWMRNAIWQIKRNIGDSDFDRLCRKVEQAIETICKKSIGATEREIANYCRPYKALPPQQRDQVLNALRRNGVIDSGTRIGANGKAAPVWLIKN